MGCDTECCNIDPGAAQSTDDRLRVEMVQVECHRGELWWQSVVRPRDADDSATKPEIVERSDTVDAFHHHEGPAQGVVEAIEHDPRRRVTLLGDQPLHDGLT